MRRRLLEVCVDDAAGLQAAIEGGADRIELCSALSVGGLTPSPGLMALAAEAPVPVHAMIRPRAGAFLYDEADLRQMENDIRTVAGFGLEGIVIGANHADGRLDEGALARLLSAAEGLPATLHRAIDLVPDVNAAVDLAVSLGFERILTSGGEKTALAGLERIAGMLARAAGRIEIMPGSGITVDTVGPILARLADVDIHASCSSPGAEEPENVLSLGFATGPQKRTDALKVRALKARMG